MPTFDPSLKTTTSFSQLHSLDLFPGPGLAPEDFWKLFSKCEVCHNLMTTRTVPFHICPEAGEGDYFWFLFQTKCMTHGDVFSPPGKDNRSTNINLKAFFLPLVDAHNVGHEAGIPEDAFRAIFHMCDQCGRYMTKRLSLHHIDWDEDFESEYDGPSRCIYLRQEEEESMNATEYKKKHM